MRQHPLEECLILRIIAQLMIKIEPQRRRQEQCYRNEGGNRERISPGESAPPPQPRRGGGLGERLGGRRRLIDGYD
ncbi:hypothetical protein [Actinoplanes sp. RD1]|uniref:hypothetical protein n=1 Tax=Actinoplanes sp. RD1 TaxID=3064538 RepID=UPI0027410675|nr:hypothetical protein [Actinoplanes sp. RD1]